MPHQPAGSFHALQPIQGPPNTPHASPWKFICALPGVALQFGGELHGLRIASPTDIELQKTANNDPWIADFLGRFTDPFHQPLKPSAVLQKSSSKKKPSLEQITELRDALAVSSICRARAGRLRSHRQRYSPSGTILFSDQFDIYPVHPGNDHGWLAVVGVNQRGMNEQQHFYGQPAPVYLHPQNYTAEHDPVLFDALVNVLGSTKPEDAQFRRCVRRSIHLAFESFRAPVGQFTATLDHAQRLSMLEAAFQVLLNNNPKEKVTSKVVLDHIKTIPWISPRLRKRTRHKVSEMKGGYAWKPRKNRKHITLAQQVYSRLAAVRNGILHGNPMPRNRLEKVFRKSWLPLNFIAPHIYRNFLLHQISQRGHTTFPRQIGNSSSTTQIRACTHQMNWENLIL